MKHSIKNNFVFLNYVRKFTPAYFYIRFITVLLSPLQPLISIFIMKIALDHVADGEPPDKMLFLILVGFAIAIACNLLIHLINIGIGAVAKRIMTGKIQGVLLEKAEKLDFSCFDDTEFYNQYTRAMYETDGRCISVFDTFISFLSKIVTLFTVMTVLAVLSPLIILLCALLVALNFGLNKVKNKLDYQYDRQLTPFRRKVEYLKKIFYEPQYAQEVRMGRLGGLMRKKFDAAIEDMMKIDRDYCWPNALLSAGFNSVGYILTFSVMLIACLQISAGLLSIGGFAALLNGAEQLFMGFYGLLGSVTEMELHSKYIDNFKTIIHYEAQIETAEQHKALCDREGNIELKNVYFAYPRHTEYALKNVSLSIPKGKKIAIVGYNGAGKSTLVKLLLRLYDPSSGEILWNHNSYSAYHTSDLRRNYSVVFQNYQCYALSVEENITLSENLSDEEKAKLIQAEKISGIDKKIDSLPEKGRTCMSKEFDESGVPFSGGEQQKVAISRAFYEDRNVIILDEPSSALDPIAEYEMILSMKELTRDKTVIMISHRLSAIRMFDEIYVMVKGEIAEHGSHEELMKLSGKYAEMFTKQASNYQEEIRWEPEF